MKQKAPSFNGVFLCSGGGTRTPDLVVNSHSLYPVFIKKVDKTKNTETQNRPNTAMKSPGEPTTLLILYHHTQNGTTVLDSRFQHSTG